MQNDIKARLLQARNQMDSNITKKMFSESGYGTIKNDSNVRKVEIKNIHFAPEEWNFYKPLSQNKMEELLESISHKGLLVPIIVWEQKNDNYIALSGNNRLRAFKMLYKHTKKKQYLKIDALIKKHDEITENEAREIIIDTNWVQRQLTNIEKSMSINFKYNILFNKKKSEKQGLIRDIIAKEYNISGRQIDNYRRLRLLIPELQNMIEKDELKLANALKLVCFDSKIQKHIYMNFKNKLIWKYVKLLKKDMTLDEINKVFLKEIDFVELKIKVPKHLKEILIKEIKELIEQHKNNISI